MTYWTRQLKPICESQQESRTRTESQSCHRADDSQLGHPQTEETHHGHLRTVQLSAWWSTEGQVKSEAS